jgi:outer membrane protein assembly factor BamB
MNLFFSTLLVALATSSILAAVSKEDWSQWRGPTLNGSSRARDLPALLDPSSLSWTAPLPGKAGSTPIVSGDRVFVTSPDDQKNLLLLCLDRKSGRELWRQTVGVGDKEVGRNNMCAPSPITDGHRVYTLFGTGDFAAFDLDGKPLWNRNLGKDFGSFAVMWIFGSSPLLHEGRLYLQVLQRDEMPPDYPRFDGKSKRDSFLLCLDAKSGKDLWRHIRKTDSTKESSESYATPIPFQGPNGLELIVVGGDYLSGHKFRDGSELWRARLYEKRDDWYRIVTSPVIAAGRILASGPKGQPVVAFRGGGKGDVTTSHRDWEFRDAPTDWSTPCVLNGALFVLDGQKRRITRINPETGAPVWSGKIPGASPIWGSLSGGEGKLYCHDENGTVYALSAGDKFEVLSSHFFAGEAPCKGSIALANGQILVRTAKALHAFGQVKLRAK